MISGTIEQTDYLAAQYLHRRPSRKRLLVYVGLFLSSVTAGTMLLLFHQYIFGGALVGAAIGGVIGELVTRYLYVPWRAGLIYRQQKSLHESYQYRWDNEHLSAESASGAGRRPWAHYAKWKEDEKLFLLYHSDIIFEMVPKRWFTHASHVNDLRAYLQKHIVT